MSSPIFADVPSAFSGIVPVNFTVDNITAAKVVQEPLLAAVESATTPLYYGGCTIIDLTASSTDGASKNVIIYTGRITTTQETTQTGAMATTTSTATRVNNSFINDGFLIGDLVMLFSPVGTTRNAGVDGILCTVTTVAALTLTFSGTPIAALALATGTRLVRVSNLFMAPVAASSGTNGTLANVKILGNSLDQSSIFTERKLGSTEMLIAAMQSNVSALPAYVNISGQVARY